MVGKSEAACAAEIELSSRIAARRLHVNDVLSRPSTKKTLANYR
jgi:hypothetical protein